MEAAISANADQDVIIKDIHKKWRSSLAQMLIQGVHRKTYKRLEATTSANADQDVVIKDTHKTQKSHS